jgi:hypothetical protein
MANIKIEKGPATAASLPGRRNIPAPMIPLIPRQTTSNRFMERESFCP